MHHPTRSKATFKTTAVCAALAAAFYQHAAQATPGCVATSGDIYSETCDSSNGIVQVQTYSGTSSMTVTDLTGYHQIQILPHTGEDGPFDQTINIDGTTAITNTTYSAVIAEYTPDSGLGSPDHKITINIGESVTLTSRNDTSETPGTVWARNEKSGDIVINNSGTVSFDGNGSAGAAITGTTNDGSVTITNHGTVTATSGGRGIYADGGYNSTSAEVHIINSGTISGDGAAARAINYNGLAIIENSGSATSTTRQGLVAWSNNGPVTITNSGTVTSYKDIALQAANEIGDITVTNSGTVNAPDDATAATNAGLRAGGIWAEVDMDSCASCNGNVSVTNTATGVVNAPADYAVNAATPQGNITLSNAGKITGTYGVNLDALDGTITGSNSGTIYSTATDGYGIYVAHANSGTITNSNLVHAVNAAVGSANGATINVVNNSGATLAGGIGLGSGGNLTNSGTLALKTNTTSTNVTSTGDITKGTIGGNFVQTSTGVLNIAAKSNSTTDGYSTLAVGGTATIDGKAYVDVKQVNTLAVGQKLVGVVSAGTLSGNFKSVDDNSAMFNFTSLATTGANGRIDLQVVNTLTATDAVKSIGASPALGAANTIDSIIQSGNATPEMNQVIQALGALPTSTEVGDAVSEMVPLLTSGTTSATQGAIGGISKVVQARVESNRGLSSGDGYIADRNVWAKPFGSWANQDTRNNVDGYDASTYGIVFGADAPVSSTLRLGGAFAYARSDINGNSSITRQSANVDIFQLIGYGSLAIDEQTEVNFQAMVGQNQNQGQRRIAFMNKTASADYNSQSAALGIGLGHVIALDDKTSFTPSIRADYTWIRDDSYQESGADALNLNVNSRTTQAMVLGLDGKLTHKLSDGLLLAGNLGIGYDTINEGSSITSAFAGAPGAAFVTRGLDPSPWLVRGGLGATYKVKTGFDLTARYDAEYRESFLNQSVSLKARWLF